MSDKPKLKVLLTAKDVENMNAHARSSVDYTQQYQKVDKYDEGLLPGMDYEAHRAAAKQREFDEQLSTGLLVLACLVGLYLVYRAVVAVKRRLLDTKEVEVNVIVKISDKRKHD